MLSRSCSVAGRPNVFYVGVNNGGVWRTTDAGRTWVPIFDDQPTGSIGAVAVAPSNPEVLYVGSGEGLQRPDLSTGDDFRLGEELVIIEAGGLADYFLVVRDIARHARHRRLTMALRGSAGNSLDMRNSNLAKSSGSTASSAGNSIPSCSAWSI